MNQRLSIEADCRKLVTYYPPSMASLGTKPSSQ